MQGETVVTSNVALPSLPSGMKLKALRLDDHSGVRPSEVDVAEAPAPFHHGVLALGLGQTRVPKQLENAALQLGLKFGTPQA